MFLLLFEFHAWKCLNIIIYFRIVTKVTGLPRFQLLNPNARKRHEIQENLSFQWWMFFCSSNNIIFFKPFDCYTWFENALKNLFPLWRTKILRIQLSSQCDHGGNGKAGNFCMLHTRSLLRKNNCLNNRNLLR